VPNTCPYPEPEQSIPCPQSHCLRSILTLILLMWRIWWASINASKWKMGFNSAFKGLIYAWVFQVVSFPQVSAPTPCMHLSFPHTCYMTRPSHSSHFDHLNNIWWRVWLIKLLIRKFSPLPLLPHLSQAEIFSSAPYSQTLSVYIPISVSASNIHTHLQQRQNYSSVYLTSVYSWIEYLKTKDFVPNGSKHSLTSNCS